jgi:Protein of unknown function (DUF3788)
VRTVKADPAEESKPPSARELATVLGRSHAAFVALTQRGSAFTCEWKRYSKKSPWVLKVSRGDRTLFYATPMADAFETTVVLGERAAQAALAGRVSKALHTSIRAAKPYVEGRPVRVMVKHQADLARVEELVAVKLNPTGDTAVTSSVGRRRGPTTRS